MRQFKVKTWQAGMIVGLLAALIQTLYNVMPKSVEGVSGYGLGPVAYGYCMFCHVRDMINWFLKNYVTWMTTAPISAAVPTLTIVGLIVGAFLSAILTKTYRVRTTIKPYKSFVYGLIVASFAAILGACPIRIVLRAAYIDITGFVGILGMVIGTIIGIELLLKRGVE